jgi:hypothetical protein
MRVMTANEPYRLEPMYERGSQAFDLGSKNGPYRPEIRVEFFWTAPRWQLAAPLQSTQEKPSSDSFFEKSRLTLYTKWGLSARLRFSLPP